MEMGQRAGILFINRTQIRRIQKRQKMNADCRLFLSKFGPVPGVVAVGGEGDGGVARKVN